MGLLLHRLQLARTLGLPEPKFLVFGGKWRNLPTYTFTHLGWICVLAGVAVAGATVLQPGALRSRLRQLGRTSLLMYWVHVDLVYGHLAGEYALDLKGRLTLGQTAIGLLMLTLLVLPLSWARTRYFASFKPAFVFEKLWRDFVAQVREAWRKGRFGCFMTGVWVPVSHIFLWRVILVCETIQLRCIFAGGHHEPGNAARSRADRGWVWSCVIDNGSGQGQ